MEANLTYLRREVMKYELDPNHTITPKHISLRMSCVVKYGAEAVREVVASVCKELLEDRICYFAERAKKPSVPEVVTKRKSFSAPARNAKNKRISTTSRMGHQIQHGRR